MTETVTPGWLELPPTETVIGKSVVRAFAGICTFNCMTPETKPGASPAKMNRAGRPSIKTATASTGDGVRGGTSDTVVTFPVTPFGDV